MYSNKMPHLGVVTAGVCRGVAGNAHHADPVPQLCVARVPGVRVEAGEGAGPRLLLLLPAPATRLELSSLLLTLATLPPPMMQLPPPLGLYTLPTNSSNVVCCLNFSMMESRDLALSS